MNYASYSGADSGNKAMGHRYGTARVSKRSAHRSAACLRARYRTDLAWSISARPGNLGHDSSKLRVSGSVPRAVASVIQLWSHARYRSRY